MTPKDRPHFHLHTMVCTCTHTQKIIKITEARCGGTLLESQHSGRPKQEDYVNFFFFKTVSLGNSPGTVLELSL